MHQPNMGQCAAANLALSESQGDYIKFFDADDKLAPETVELQLQRLSGSVTAVASCEWGRFYRDDLSTFRLNPESVWHDMESTDWLVEAWTDGRPMMQCALWLIPRRILNCAGPWDERLTLINDFELFTRVLCHCEEVRFTPGARLFYRSGIAGSLSCRKGRKATESAFLSLVTATSHLLERRSDQRARTACANILQDFIYSCYPEYADLRAQLEARIQGLGGSDLAPDGPPRFQYLRRLVGWRIARRIQRHFASRGPTEL